MGWVMSGVVSFYCSGGGAWGEGGRLTVVWHSQDGDLCD